jgi:hypothetical protein
MSQYIPVRAAAELLGVSTQAVYKRIRVGSLTSQGNSVLRSEVEEMTRVPLTPQGRRMPAENIDQASCRRWIRCETGQPACRADDVALTGLCVDFIGVRRNRWSEDRQAQWADSMVRKMRHRDNAVV